MAEGDHETTLGGELQMSSVLLKLNAKGEVQPEIKVYTDPKTVAGDGMEAAVKQAAEIAKATLADLTEVYGWPGIGPRGVRTSGARP